MNDISELRAHIKFCIGFDGQGHWMSKQPISPDVYIGFTSCILMRTTGSLYIGSKQFYTERTKTLSGKKKKVKEQSDWDAAAWHPKCSHSLHSLGRQDFWVCNFLSKTENILGRAEMLERPADPILPIAQKRCLLFGTEETDGLSHSAACAGDGYSRPAD